MERSTKSRFTNHPRAPTHRNNNQIRQKTHENPKSHFAGFIGFVLGEGDALRSDFASLVADCIHRYTCYVTFRLKVA